MNKFTKSYLANDLKQVVAKLNEMDNKTPITYTQFDEILAQVQKEDFTLVIYRRLKNKQVGLPYGATSLISADTLRIKRELNSGLYNKNNHDDKELIDMFREELEENETKIKDLINLEKQKRLIAWKGTNDSPADLKVDYKPLNAKDLREKIQEIITDLEHDLTSVA